MLRQPTFVIRGTRETGSGVETLMPQNTTSEDTAATTEDIVAASPSAAQDQTNADLDALSAQPSAEQAVDEQAEEPKKKRRRRRRGGRGRGRGGGKTDEQSTDQTDESTANETVEETAREEQAETPVEAPTPRDPDVFAETPFDQLGLRNSVMKGVRKAGFIHATHIQSTLIPKVLSGADVLGQAKTGSGKTAAFGLPLFHMATRALAFQSFVLCPTRELAIQITGELSELGQFTPIRVVAIYGGQAIPTQIKELEQNPEIVVATPGRLMDFLERRRLHFNNVRFMVLDEVDRMLDIGFRDDIRKILRNIKSEHQTIFVSATISEEIEQLGRSFMKKDAEKIVAAQGSLTVSLVDQMYLTVEPWDKKQLLAHLLTHEEPAKTLVFCRTKRTVDNLMRFLNRKSIDASSIHGDMPQSKRNQVMRSLRGGKLSVLIASDLAARGIDVDDISHVINYDLPEDPEVYIHRIGRTARAGRKGVAWSLVTPEQGPLLTQIEQLANVEIPHLDYPDFKPGEPPADIRSERQQKQVRLETARSQSRFDAAAPPPVKAAKQDDLRFPGGLVPTRMPAKRLQGRVKTSRSMRQKPAAPPVEDQDNKKSD